MADPDPKEADAITKYERCSYCGSPLNYAFYFCTVCATPYRPISEVIPPAAPRILTEGELIRKKVPNVWRVFWTYAFVIFVVLVLDSMLFPEEEQTAFALICGSVAILLTTAAFQVIFWRSLVVQLKQFGFFSLEAALGFVFLGVLLLINCGYHLLIFYFWGEADPPQSHLGELDMSGPAVFALFCLIPGITEEIAFRGLIQHWLGTVLRPWRAIVLASALFTALHVSIISAPYIFLVGLLLGWLKWKTRSLYPSMAIHILHNWAAITLLPMLLQ